MSSRLIVNLLLLVAVAILGAIAVFEPGHDQQASEVLLTTDQPRDIRQIVIESPDAARIRITKEDSGWQIREPIAVAANTFRIDSLLQIVRAKSYSHYPVQGLDLSRYQLQKPLGRISLDDTTIQFGGTEPLENRRYVLVDGQVHLIADNHYYQTMLSLPAVVDNALVPAGRKLQALHLPTIELRHGNNGSWQTIPRKPDISMDDINVMLDEWRNARALNISAYENDSPVGRVTLDFDDGSSLEYDVLEKEPDWILGRRDIGMRFHLGQTLAEQLWLTGPLPVSGE